MSKPMKHSREFLALVEEAQQHTTEVSAHDAFARSQQGAVLIDIREDHEWQSELLLAVQNEAQLSWLAAFSIIECLRTGAIGEVNEEFWEIFDLTDPTEREELAAEAKLIARRGHGCGCLV